MPSLGDCRHYRENILGHAPCCHKCVDYRALVGGADFGWLRRLPCEPSHAESPVRCAFYSPLAGWECELLDPAPPIFRVDPARMRNRYDGPKGDIGASMSIEHLMPAEKPKQKVTVAKPFMHAGRLWIATSALYHGPGGPRKVWAYELIPATQYEGFVRTLAQSSHEWTLNENLRGNHRGVEVWHNGQAFVIGDKAEFQADPALRAGARPIEQLRLFAA